MDEDADTTTAADDRLGLAERQRPPTDGDDQGEECSVGNDGGASEDLEWEEREVEDLLVKPDAVEVCPVQAKGHPSAHCDSLHQPGN